MLQKGFFYSFNVQGQRRRAASSRSVRWTGGLDIDVKASRQLCYAARRFDEGLEDCLAVRGSAKRPVTYLWRTLAMSV